MTFPASVRNPIALTLRSEWPGRTVNKQSTHQPVQARACGRGGSFLGVVGPKTWVKIFWGWASRPESRSRFGLAAALEDLGEAEWVSVVSTELILNSQPGSTQHKARHIFSWNSYFPKISNFYSLNLKMYKHLRGKLPHKYRESQLCASPPTGLPHRTNWPSLSADSIAAELSSEWKFICKSLNEYSREFCWYRQCGKISRGPCASSRTTLNEWMGPWCRQSLGTV